jgi:serpin B
MGMTKAFEDRNEFSRITDNSIFISRVLHDTSIEVTESGTIAAAATVVEMREKANFTRIVNANRPFIYIIREKSTGVILFIGSLENPAKF